MLICCMKRTPEKDWDKLSIVTSRPGSHNALFRLVYREVYFRLNKVWRYLRECHTGLLQHLSYVNLQCSPSSSGQSSSYHLYKITMLQILRLCHGQTESRINAKILHSFKYRAWLTAIVLGCHRLFNNANSRRRYFAILFPHGQEFCIARWDSSLSSLWVYVSTNNRP